MALDCSHVLDPVDARRTGHVARKAEGKGSSLLPMFVRNGISVLDVSDCG
jgi:hypothetical protein